MEKKAINIGGSDFGSIIRNGYYYVDKTLMIKELIDSGSAAILFTRPRRFGKSLNISMLKAFFEIGGDNADLFHDLKIWQCGERYRNEQGKYPLIYFSFFDFSVPNWETAYHYFQKAIADEYTRHDHILEGDCLKPIEKKMFRAVQERNVDYVVYQSSLKDLCRWLYRYYKVKPIILIDEYDKPVQKAHASHYYNEMMDFLKGFYTGGLKDNPNLTKGILTGVLRIAKESIFTGMNNFDVYSMFSNNYGEYFGFTVDEVEIMAETYSTIQDMDKEHSMEDKYSIKEVRSWYNGYSFGGTEIYNPWSVLQYFAKGRVPEAYWLSTSGNDIIHSMFKNMSSRMLKDLTSLVQGKSITATIPIELAYPDLEKDRTGNALYSVLLMTGYLKKVSGKKLGGDERTGQNLKYRCELMIPNREIMEVYQAEILEYFEQYCRVEVSDAVQEAIVSNDADSLQKELSTFLMESTSNFDGAYEVFYQGLMLGNVAMMNAGYYVSSNLESGEGRFDIQMEPKKPGLPGIIMELKSVREEYATAKDRDRNLEKVARGALQQIEKNRYTTNFKMRGIRDILLYGMAFQGKHVKVLSKSLE